MKKKVAGVFSVALASSVIVSGCGNSGDDNKTDESTSNGGSGVAAEQVLNLTETAEIPSMDPAKATDAVSFIVMNNVYEGLYRLGENDELKEGVAIDHKVSEDGLTYTFNLREDAKWSNGEAVTAHDFVYAWQRALNPTTASEYAYIMYDIKNAAAVNAGDMEADQLGVKAEDDHTLVVELENAVPFFAEMTVFGTFMPLNQEFVESQGDKFSLEADTAIYNGPFVLSAWSHEQSWQYQRNDQYWDKDNVQLDEINVNVVKDTAAQVNLFETGKADFVPITAEFVDKYSSSEEFSTVLDPSTFFLRLNQVDELENTNLRRAISMAIDKESMASVILNNGSVAIDGLVPGEFVKSPDGVDFRKENGDLLSYDVEQAQEYWETAKEELGSDSMTIELLTYDTDSSKKIAEYIQAELEKNLDGITIEIKQQPFKQKLEMESNMNYQMSLAGWGPDYPDPMTFLDMFITDGSHNQMNFSNEEYDRLITAAKGELLQDLPARWDAMLEAEQILMDEAAITPLYQRGYAYLTRTNVRNLFSHNFGGDYSFKWTYIAE